MHSENKTVLSVENLCVSMHDTEVLHHIDFELKKGELAAVVGPNGAGKTTLFRALLGMIPYQGEVRIMGKPVNQVLGRIGYVPQRFSFDKSFPITVEEFLKITGGNNSDEDLSRVLKEVEMLEMKGRLLGELSGGQLQRILIGRALLNDPELLLLDEPTMGIDIEGEKSFYDIIRNQNSSRRVTVVMISHEINMVYKYATQVICLNRDLICFGVPKEAITEEVLKELYGEDVEFRKHSH